VNDKNAVPAVQVYTDGASKGNPGPGGWGVLLTCNGEEREMFGGEATTTNNRMEMTAVIEALRALKRPSKVVLHRTPTYVMKGTGVDPWVEGQGLAHRRRTGEERRPVEVLDALVAQHQVEWKWVKGHSGHDGNERADALANKGVPVA
jgi:ribonuclease HI